MRHGARNSKQYWEARRLDTQTQGLLESRMCVCVCVYLGGTPLMMPTGMCYPPPCVSNSVATFLRVDKPTAQVNSTLDLHCVFSFGGKQRGRKQKPGLSHMRKHLHSGGDLTAQKDTPSLSLAHSLQIKKASFQSIHHGRLFQVGRT